MEELRAQFSQINTPPRRRRRRIRVSHCPSSSSSSSRARKRSDHPVGSSDPMAGGTERYLYYVDLYCIVRVRLSPLLNGEGKVDLPLDVEYIEFAKKKLPYGSIPLHLGGRLYLAGCHDEYDSEDETTPGNPDSDTVVVEVDLNVASWKINDPIRREDDEKKYIARAKLPYLRPTYATPMVAEFENKLFFFHAETKETVNGIKCGGEIVDLRTGEKDVISCPPPFDLGRSGHLEYVWGPYFSAQDALHNTRHTFDMRIRKWLDPWRLRTGDMSFDGAALKVGYPTPFFFPKHGFAHLGNNLCITFTGNSKFGVGTSHLILYQFSSDDLKDFSGYRILDELDLLFEHYTSSRHILHLGGGDVCMTSIVNCTDLEVATFRVNGMGKPAQFLGRSICKHEAIPCNYDLNPRFMFTIEHPPAVEQRSAKRSKHDHHPDCRTDAQSPVEQCGISMEE